MLKEIITDFAIIALAIFLIFSMDTGYAYYRTDKLANDMYFQGSRGYSAQGKGEDVSVLYDNLDGTSSRTISRPIMYARSKNFVPADIIDCNTPIRITFHHSVSPKNALANLLYADLKLKKLYEDKKALRQRSIEIIAGLSVPFIEHIMPSYRLAKPGLSVHRETKELQRNYRAVRNSIQLSTFRSYKVDLSSLSNPDSWTTLDMKQQRAKRIRVAGSKSLVGGKTGLTSGNGTSGGTENSEKVQSNMPRQQEKRSLNQNKTGIPWIFRIFIKLQELMFSSPREVIISLLIVAFLVSLLFSGKRR